MTTPTQFSCNLLEIHNIDFEKSGLYNQRGKIADINGDFEMVIDANKNEFLQFNEDDRVNMTLYIVDQFKLII